jgi:hypothetical protein
MDTIDLYQVECPKCHGQLNSVAPLSGQTTCPFCCTVYHITANVTLQTEIPAQIVPFTTLAGDFEQSAHTMLLHEDYAPANISRIISFKDVKGFYLPVYLYEGQYECAWSCKIKQTSTNNDAAESTKEVYRSQNGVSKGEYVIICMACDEMESGKDLSEYVRTLDFRGDSLKAFQPDDLNNYFFMTRSHDAQKTWRQYGEDSMNCMVRKNTLIQLQSNDVKDFKCNVSSSSLSEGQFILYPVWILNYLYDGELHHIYMDGTGRNGVKGTSLIDHALKAEAEKPFVVLKYIGVAAVVVPLLMLLVGWYWLSCISLAVMGLVFFGYLYYARWHKARVIRKARKSLRFEV